MLSTSSLISQVNIMLMIDISSILQQWPSSSSFPKILAVLSSPLCLPWCLVILSSLSLYPLKPQDVPVSFSFVPHETPNSIHLKYIRDWEWKNVFVREATQKKEKKITTRVNYLQKWRTQPPTLPLFHNNFSHFWNLKINVFLQLLRVCEWGGLTKTR